MENNIIRESKKIKINVVVDRDEGIEIDFNNIKLSSHNPRYTTLNSLSTKLVDLIKQDDVAEEIIMKKLLSGEGDFVDMVRLMDSIKNDNFDSSEENIILIKKDAEFIVAEGNRRTLCIKLLSRKLQLPPLSSIEVFTDNIDDFVRGNEKINFKIERRKNYEAILKLINSFSYDEIKFNVKIISDDESLWKIIYTKHIAGERIGMRQWSRGKYFTDILSFFRDGLNLNNNKERMIKIRKLIKRNPNVIVKDFKHAQFVREVLINSFNNNFSEEEEEENQVFKYMKKIKVSSLQTNFSLSKIESVALNNLNFTKKRFDECFKVIFDGKNNLIKITGKFKKPILTFIYKKFTQGIITTRPIKKEYERDFNNEIENILRDININTKKKQDDKVLKKINPFSFSIKNLKDIINVAEMNDNDEKIRENFIIVVKSKENLKKFSKVNIPYANFNEPKMVFNILKDQLIYNNDKFLSASAATLRSLLEQILIWGGYFVDDIINKVVAGNGGIINKRDDYIGKLIGNKIHKIYNTIKTNCSINMGDLRTTLNAITKTDKKDLAKRMNHSLKNGEDDILNEFIHASHRIYKKPMFDEQMKKFINWENMIFELLKDLDYNKINNLNQKMMTELNKDLDYKKNDNLNQK